MPVFLRQSTAVDVALGPFLDSTDGVTAETGLTISQADVRLKKNDGAWAQVNDNTAATHEENGWYEKELNTTDTNTVGRLLIAVHESGALPVWHEFWVLEEAVYDAFFAASAVGYIANAPVNVAQFGGSNGTFASGRPEVNTTLIEGSDATNQIRDAVVDDATRIDASALNTLSSHDPGENIMGATDLGTGAGLTSLASASDLSTLDGVADAIKVTTDKLDDTLEDQGGGTFGFTEAALQEAPSGGGGGGPTAGEIADAVWTEAIADHSGESGSTAEALAAAGGAGDPWITALPGSYSSGQAGNIIGNLLDEAISSRAAASDLSTLDGKVDDILEDTGTTLQNELDGIQADTEDIQSRLPSALVGGRIDATVDATGMEAGAVAAIADGVWDESTTGHTTGGTFGAQAATDIDAILADTNELQTDWANGGRLDLLIDAILADTAELQGDWANGGRLDLLIDAIKAKTDQLAFTVSNQVDANAITLDEDEVWDDVIEGSLTARQLLRLFASVLLGKLSGAATTTNTFRDTGDSKNRVTATVDSDGNRTAVTLDAT